jgi:hypothetical protein
MTSRAAVERVRAPGGRADEPERRPYGLHAEYVDDQGATFRLWQPANWPAEPPERGGEPVAQPGQALRLRWCAA